MINSARETADLVHEMQVNGGSSCRFGCTDGAVPFRSFAYRTKQLKRCVPCDADGNRRDDIAKLMNGLYEQGYTDVQTQEIKLENGTYNSIIEVKR
jgi:hypothetical protein